MKEAMYYKRLDEDRVLCALCPHHCNIHKGGRGACMVRKNVEGTLYTLNYNRIAALAIDPIEKKPLYHFYPGTHILSAGTVGCNLKCSFCQNWHIAHKEAQTEDTTSIQLVDIAQRYENNIGIAYTYNEPSIWYEFVLETAKRGKEKGLKNILVTNGFISEEPLKELLPFVDAMNIDVKGFTERFYKDVCKGLLEPVKRIVEISAKSCHVEITTLVITDLNDSIEEIREISSWLSSINRNIPLHLSRYFPNYKLSNNPTPASVLEAARNEAEKYLNYVYTGNIPNADNTTYCPNCKRAIISRDGYAKVVGMEKGICIFCGEKIHITY